VGAVLSEDQQVTTIPAGSLAGDAIALMRETGFSQLPVVSTSQRVVGLFSFRSFAEAAVELPRNRQPTSIAVEDAMVQPVWAQPTEELGSQYAALDRLDCVLVGDPARLRGVMTTVDVLGYLDRVAEPFVRLGELERALRTAVSLAVDENQLSQIAAEALRDRYADRSDSPPAVATDMTLDELVCVVLHGPSWPRLSEVFGINRETAAARLSDLAAARNAALHFRRDLTEQEIERIRVARDWVAMRLSIAGISDEDEA
jgi:CBS domain-containing protein